MIVSVWLALLSALLYGVSDFFGAAAARRLRVVPATTMTYLFAAVAIVIALFLIGGTWSTGAVLWGSAAGVFAIVGFVTFYAAMAVGPMSLVSPLIALLESVMPVTVAVALGERLVWWAWVAVILAMLGGALISVQRGTRGPRVTTRTVILAAVSGISFGLSVVSLDAAPHDSRLVPAVAEVLVGLALMGLLLALARAVPRTRSVLSLLDLGGEIDHVPSRRNALILVATGGLMLGVGNALLITALQSGSLAIVGVLIGLYPLVTIVFARIAIKERMAPLQMLGVALAVVASAMLALA